MKHQWRFTYRNGNILHYKCDNCSAEDNSPWENPGDLAKLIERDDCPGKTKETSRNIDVMLDDIILKVSSGSWSTWHIIDICRCLRIINEKIDNL